MRGEPTGSERLHQAAFLLVVIFEVYVDILCWELVELDDWLFNGGRPRVLRTHWRKSQGFL